MLVKLRPGIWLNDAINAAFPDGLPVTNEPQVDINRVPCYLALPETADAARKLVEIAKDNRAPACLMTFLMQYQSFPVEAHAIAWMKDET